jgi:hypothetical protein
MVKILICGSREWNNFDKIKNILLKYPQSNETIIIHGNCKGADKISGYLAKQLNMTVEIYSADWKKYGRAAGPIKNQQMLDEGNPEICYAFHENIEISKGTKDMVNKCKLANIPVNIIN